MKVLIFMWVLMAGTVAQWVGSGYMVQEFGSLCPQGWNWFWACSAQGSGPDVDPWDGPHDSDAHLQSAVGDLRWKSGWNSAWIFMIRWQSRVRNSDQRDAIKDGSSGGLGTLTTGNTRPHAHDTGSPRPGRKNVEGANGSGAGAVPGAVSELCVWPYIKCLHAEQKRRDADGLHSLG